MLLLQVTKNCFQTSVMEAQGAAELTWQINHSHTGPAEVLTPAETVVQAFLNRVVQTAELDFVEGFINATPFI